MRGRRLWFQFEAHGAWYKVYVAKEITLEDGTECDGSVSGNTILVRQNADLNWMKMKALHEILHVCFNAHTKDILDHVLGKGWDRSSPDREEMVVSFLEPMLFAILSGNGLLHIPQPPRLA